MANVNVGAGMVVALPVNDTPNQQARVVVAHNQQQQHAVPASTVATTVSLKSVKMPSSISTMASTVHQHQQSPGQTRAHVVAHVHTSAVAATVPLSTIPSMSGVPMTMAVPAVTDVQGQQPTPALAVQLPPFFSTPINAMPVPSNITGVSSMEVDTPSNTVSTGPVVVSAAVLKAVPSNAPVSKAVPLSAAVVVDAKPVAASVTSAVPTTTNTHAYTVHDSLSQGHTHTSPAVQLSMNSTTAPSISTMAAVQETLKLTQAQAPVYATHSATIPQPTLTPLSQQTQRQTPADARHTFSSPAAPGQ